MTEKAISLSPCPFRADPCCMRTPEGGCEALRDTRFKDGECHFRKVRALGPNLYDLERKEKDRHDL